MVGASLLDENKEKKFRFEIAVGWMLLLCFVWVAV